MKKAYGGVLSEVSRDGRYWTLRRPAIDANSHRFGWDHGSQCRGCQSSGTTGSGGLKSDSLDSLLFLAEQSAGGCFDPTCVED